MINAKIIYTANNKNYGSEVNKSGKDAGELKKGKKDRKKNVFPRW